MVKTTVLSLKTSKYPKIDPNKMKVNLQYGTMFLSEFTIIFPRFFIG